MKLLAIHNANDTPDKQNAVDLWRIWRPLREIAKRSDWEITEREHLIHEDDALVAPEAFTKEELEKAEAELKQYDVIYTSYSSILNPALFTLCKIMKDRHNVKLVIDVDDNVFAIEEENIGWWMKVTHQQTFFLQQIVRHADYLTTTTDRLKKELAKRNENAKIYVVPNFISEDYKAGPPVNGTKVKIGYFGGASHYSDLHETGFLPALEKLMHENKNVIAETCGIYAEDYLPKARYTYNEGARGHKWLTDIIPKLNYDICVAPLRPSSFTECKSVIKWMESAMIHAPLIASNVTPYKQVIRSGFDGVLVANDSGEWYKALKDLVDNEQKRRDIAKAAEGRVRDKYLIENNYNVLENALKEIYEDNQTKPQSIILQA